MKLKNKVALITGGGIGIGKATAILFAKEGAKVVITGRTEKTLKHVAEETRKEGLKIDYLVSDVAKEEDCKEAIDYTINKYGRIDILFNNAGVLYTGTTHETPTEIWDKTFAVNARGTYLMCRYTIPHMCHNYLEMSS
ncbi:MAG: SDR family NAD(P)-dependent oxidoreductase [Thermodesulfobacteriota bacterium]